LFVTENYNEVSRAIIVMYLFCKCRPVWWYSNEYS